MQWLYAYLATDILLLLRFFFLFIVHTKSTECTNNRLWYLFICYFEATIDNYLNTLEAYILLALNLGRYAQIARNKNVYVTNIRLLTFAHLAIYLMPLISLIVQFFVGWANLEENVSESCDIRYTNVYAKIFNTITAFVLPISLNIIVIYASAHYIHLASQLRQSKHYVSAREKYHRSLVIQFLVFYTVWLFLWSPNIIGFQLQSRNYDIMAKFQLLNCIEITLDPIIIAGLDARFRHVWRDLWKTFKGTWPTKWNRNQRRIAPIVVSGTVPIPLHIRRTAA
jgi:hypothetical protein